MCPDGTAAPVPKGACCGSIKTCPAQYESWSHDDDKDDKQDSKVKQSKKDSKGDDDSDSKKHDDDKDDNQDSKVKKLKEAMIHAYGKKDKGDSKNRRLSDQQNLVDAFEVRITDPLPVEADQDMVDKLLAQGAWRGITDGREHHFGPVAIRRVFLLSDTEVLDSVNAHSTEYSPQLESEEVATRLSAATVCGALVGVFAMAVGWRRLCAGRSSANIQYTEVEAAYVDDVAQ